MDLWDVYSLMALVLVTRALLHFMFTWAKILYLHFLSNILFSQRDLVKDYGLWAVVTGSSSGIGKHYAKELAGRGINIVLISNEEENLNITAKEIENESNVETKLIFVDFSLGDEEHQKIFKVIEELDIGILVNNVGTAAGLPNLFENMTRQQMWSLLMINVGAATSMTHFVLSKMKSKGKGLIVNVASSSAMAPTPFANIYGASKAFVKHFSDALKFECKETGVEVQTICPFFVDTKIIESRAGLYPAFFFPTPEDFSKNAVLTLGKVGSTAGCMAHDIQTACAELLPRRVLVWLSAKSFEVKDFKSQEKKQE